MRAEARIPVLLVDDNQADALLTVHWLKSSRAVGAAHVVHDGEAALARLRDPQGFSPGERPQLILLDVNLPRLTGWEVLAELKSDPALAAIPVLMLSGSDFPDDRQRARALGAELYLVKPGEAQEFARLVEDLDRFCLARLLPPPVSRP